MYFPYFQMEDKTVKGEHREYYEDNVHPKREHLPSGSETTLSANVPYFIAGDRDIVLLIPRQCLICMGEHYIKYTYRNQVFSLVSSDHSRIPPDRIKICNMGALILAICSNCQSVLRGATLNNDICDGCVQQARRVGNVWFRLKGSYEHRECIHSSYASTEDVLDCSDYAFIEHCTNNNIPFNDIAAAFESGSVQAMRGARWRKASVMYPQSYVKTVVRHALRAGEKMSISDLAT